MYFFLNYCDDFYIIIMIYYIIKIIANLIFKRLKWLFGCRAKQERLILSETGAARFIT